MPGITLTQASAKLTTWLAADDAVASGKSYTIGDRSLTRANEAEIRKNIDVEGRTGGDHLLLVDQKGSQYISCSDVPVPFGRQFLDDVRNRTETAMTQAHSFLASELALTAQKQATVISKM